MVFFDIDFRLANFANLSKNRILHKLFIRTILVWSGLLCERKLLGAALLAIIWSVAELAQHHTVFLQILLTHVALRVRLWILLLLAWLCQIEHWVFHVEFKSYVGANANSLRRVYLFLVGGRRRRYLKSCRRSCELLDKLALLGLSLLRWLKNTQTMAAHRIDA